MASCVVSVACYFTSTGGAVVELVDVELLDAVAFVLGVAGYAGTDVVVVPCHE